MKYADARPSIRSGDILAFSHGSWLSWRGIKTNIVRIATRSTYSHIGIAWVVGGRVFLLEAVKPKLRIYPLSKAGDFYWLAMGAPWAAVAEEFALASIGERYSELAAIQAFFTPLPPGDVRECAAYVREVLLFDGINLGERSTPDAVVLAAQRLGAPLQLLESHG